MIASSFVLGVGSGNSAPESRSKTSSFRRTVVRAVSLASFLVLGIQAVAGAAQGDRPYPISPDPYITPGSLCHTPSSTRYPERIPYCERSVHRELKWEIINKYNSQLGYKIEAKDRSDYKIDHYIPLCAGGSNQEDNLWPQHKTVYAKTDALEAAVCEKMSSGRMTQAQAIAFVREAKAAPFERADEVIRKVHAY